MRFRVFSVPAHGDEGAERELNAFLGSHRVLAVDKTKDKGCPRAVSRAQGFARAHRYFLKLDIHSYYDSIDHAVLIQLLSRRFKDRAREHEQQPGLPRGFGPSSVDRLADVSRVGGPGSASSGRTPGSIDQIAVPSLTASLCVRRGAGRRRSRAAGLVPATLSGLSLGLSPGNVPRPFSPRRPQAACRLLASEGEEHSRRRSGEPTH